MHQSNILNLSVYLFLFTEPSKHLCRRYMHIIEENKKSDTMTVKQKTDAWQQVMIDFNAISETRNSLIFQ